MLTEEILRMPRLCKQKSQLLLYEDSIRRTQTLKANKGWRKLFGKLAARFGEISSVHGANRIFYPDTSRIERFLWSIALTLALAVLVYVCLLVAAVYQRKQLETVIDSTKYPLYKVPFPEVTICNRNRLNWSRLPGAKQTFLLPTHQTKELEGVFEDIISRFDTLSYGHFDHFENLPEQKLVQTLNYVNFTAVVYFMAWRCDELLMDCYWQRENFNCCEAFFPRNSQIGYCLAFNSIESKQGHEKALTDHYWPWHVGDYGPGSALTVRVSLRVTKHSPHSSNKKGALFMLAEPGVWYDTPTELLDYTSASISINSFLNFFENDTRSMPPLERGCVFDDEQKTYKFSTLKYRKFSFQNCQSKCQKDALLRYCNCTMNLFFPQTGERDCMLEDYSCLARHNKDFQQAHRTVETEFTEITNEGITCDCLTNCVSIKHSPDVRFMALRGVEREEHEPFVKLDFFNRRSLTLSYKTTMVFTWVDLLVSFGGLAGLCLGCSLISLFEFAYFFLVDAPKVVIEEHFVPTQLRHRQKIAKILLMHKK